MLQQKQFDSVEAFNILEFDVSEINLIEKIYDESLGENCALAANQSVDCRATILFTISLNSGKV